MKSFVIPVACSVALVSMSAAVVSHWWSVESFTAAVSLYPKMPPAAPVLSSAAPALASQPPPATQRAVAVSPPVAAPSRAQKEFFEALLDEVKQIRKENTALRDQVAETNRDLMKLEFRVDTHSASFRPLPTTETDPTIEPPIIDDGPGVLPPRPEVVGLPEVEE
jgi:hypothetical protein